MHVPWSAQEYERTCEDCGHTWRVPKWAAHPRRQGLPMTGGTSIVGGTTPHSGGSRVVHTAAQADAVAAAREELAETAASLRRCPECESQHYKQRAIRS